MKNEAIKTPFCHVLIFVWNKSCSLVNWRKRKQFVSLSCFLLKLKFSALKESRKLGHKRNRRQLIKKYMLIYIFCFLSGRNKYLNHPSEMCMQFVLFSFTNGSYWERLNFRSAKWNGNGKKTVCKHSLLNTAGVEQGIKKLHKHLKITWKPTRNGPQEVVKCYTALGALKTAARMNCLGCCCCCCCCCCS